MGKSRFLYELTHGDGIQAWLTLEAASVSYGKGSGYLPVIDLLKGYFKVQDRDGKRTLEPAWVSRDLQSPVPPVIANGVVFALSAGVAMLTVGGRFGGGEVTSPSRTAQAYT